MSELYVNIGGVWKPVSSVSANIGGVWKKASGVYQNVGGTWKSTLITPEASGGTVTTSGDYKIHTFTSSGSFVVSTPGVLSDVLIVAGGGAGGWGFAWTSSEPNTGGGGGAGGLKHLTNVAVTPQTYSITVGAAGVIVGEDGKPGGNGGDSVAFGYTMYGGGGGAAMMTTPAECRGKGGGSGGGGGYYSYVSTGGGGSGYSVAGKGTPGQGYDGCLAVEINGYHHGGGGGGATQAGYYSSSVQRCLGGAGYSFLSTVYAKGGDGRVAQATGAAGSGGCGGVYVYGTGQPTVNPPRNGAKGIVIIRYKYK